MDTKQILAKNGQSFSISNIFTDNFKNQLIEFTNNDPIIVKHTRDEKRFFDLKKLKKWLKKGETATIEFSAKNKRELFFLSPTNNSEQLSGIIWFSPSPLPDKVLEIFKTKFPTKTPPPRTSAIRLYENARGKKLAAPFMTKAIEKLREKYPHEIIWLSVKKTNSTALHFYKKFGFKTLLEDEEEVVWMFFKP